MKIAFIGSLNIDTTVITQTLPEKGETIMASELFQSFGGKGANQAIAAARLGAEVMMIGCVGKDTNGQAYLNQLEKEGIDTSLISCSDTPTGVALITVDSQGSNTIVVYPGSNSNVSKEQIKHQWEIIKQADILVCQFEIPLETIDYLVQCAFKDNKCIIMNPAPFHEISEKTLSKVTYITPNETELEKLTQTTDVQKGISTLLKTGVKNVIVTLGEKGCVWATNEQQITFAGYHVNAIDTTAAGDCFNGALAVALTQFEDKNQILAFANKAAALSVTKKGAVSSLPYLKDLKQFKECSND